MTCERSERLGPLGSRRGRKQDMLPLVLRVATVEDAEAIRSIYNIEVTQSTVTFDLEPRTLEVQRDWLAARSGAHSRARRWTFASPARPTPNRSAGSTTTRSRRQQ